jgi:hypothetical protein
VTGIDRLDALERMTRHLESEVAALRARIRDLETDVTAVTAWTAARDSGWRRQVVFDATRDVTS